MKNSMLHTLFIVLLVSIAAAAQIPIVQDEPVCTGNEEYSACASTCAPACTDLLYPLPKPPKICNALCRAGCVCKEGYYRSDDDKCVLPEKCCGENEKYKTCGSACVVTCQYKPTGCSKDCIAGCFCESSDYVRQSNTTDAPCIKRANCSKKM